MINAGQKAEVELLLECADQTAQLDVLSTNKMAAGAVALPFVCYPYVAGMGGYWLDPVCVVGFTCLTCVLPHFLFVFSLKQRVRQH